MVLKEAADQEVQTLMISRTDHCSRNGRVRETPAKKLVVVGNVRCTGALLSAVYSTPEMIARRDFPDAPRCPNKLDKEDKIASDHRSAVMRPQLIVRPSKGMVFKNIIIRSLVSFRIKTRSRDPEVYERSSPAVFCRLTKLTWARAIELWQHELYSMKTIWDIGLSDRLPVLLGSRSSEVMVGT